LEDLQTQVLIQVNHQGKICSQELRASKEVDIRVDHLLLRIRAEDRTKEADI
jgi:hypothetical protein